MRGTIQFRPGEQSYGLRLEDGALVSPGSSADAWISGPIEVLDGVFSGRTNAQEAYARGELSCGGNPEVLLQIAVIIERIGATDRPRSS
jgi:hypothetical protein